MSGIVQYPIANAQLPNIATDAGSVSIATATTSWQSCIAVTSSASIAVGIDVHYAIYSVGNPTAGTVDIGTGAATFEVEKISDLYVSSAYDPAAVGTSHHWVIPMEIPAGTRVVARHNLPAGTNAGTTKVQVRIFARV